MRFLVTICALLFLFSTAVAQQQADPEFNVTVENPAYTKTGPRVMFDEAHHNFHTTEGRYKPFVDLLMNDGLVAEHEEDGVVRFESIAPTSAAA